MSSEYQIPGEEVGDNEHSHGVANSEETPSVESSANPSNNLSRPGSASGTRKERGRVRFNSSSEVNDVENQRFKSPLKLETTTADPTPLASALPVTKPARASPAHSRSNSRTSLLLRHTPELEKDNPIGDLTSTEASPAHSPVRRPEPAASRLKHNPTILVGDDAAELDDEGLDKEEKIFSALAAQERAQRVATSVGTHSAPVSRRNSVEDDETPVRLPGNRSGYPVRIDDIPLVDLGKGYDGGDIDSDEETPLEKNNHADEEAETEAHRLVQVHTRLPADSDMKAFHAAPGLTSGQVTPQDERDSEMYVARPQQYRGGILSAVLRLYQAQEHENRKNSYDYIRSPSIGTTPASSGTSTPIRPKTAKWYKHKNQSVDTLASLIEASNKLAAVGGNIGPSVKPARPGMGRKSPSGRLLDAARGLKAPKARREAEYIRVHIDNILGRQKYLIKLCYALMCYGAPLHRLEEYMTRSARALLIDGQFLYLPGCMIISFDDNNTYTTQVKVVRGLTAVDLGKLDDVHEIYKEVVHDVIGVEAATQRLVTIINAQQIYPRWFIVIIYGVASACVGPFAFEARPIDMPLAFLLGMIPGWMQWYVAPVSPTFNNVFEFAAAVFTSFFARLFGSMTVAGQDNYFCFSAMAQSSIAMILPGFLVLSGALELQSRSMLAGATRMLYAIFYALVLGFGITIGTTLYGAMDASATVSTSCPEPLPYYYRWAFVPPFTLCLALVNQAKPRQMPVMTAFAFVGYITTFWVGRLSQSNAQLSNTVGALALGILGNLYSKVGHGVAVTALLPAIYVQVPSGLAASGSLLAGLTGAELVTNGSAVVNGTSSNGTTTSVSISNATQANDIVFNVAYSMIQIAISITMGLFIGALIVYPKGKKRSGLFSF